MILHTLSTYRKHSCKPIFPSQVWSGHCLRTFHALLQPAKLQVQFISMFLLSTLHFFSGIWAAFGHWNWSHTTKVEHWWVLIDICSLCASPAQLINLGMLIDPQWRQSRAFWGHPSLLSCTIPAISSFFAQKGNQQSASIYTWSEHLGVLKINFSQYYYESWDFL